MSIESDFRATLIAYAPLIAIVPPNRIAQNALDAGGTGPGVVFISTHTPSHGIDNTELGDQCQLDLQCWADTADQAERVADLVKAAVATAPREVSALVTGRSTIFDENTGQDGVQLTAEWWV